MNPIYSIILLILVGLVLVGLETFVPGFIVGSIGAILLLIATVLIYQEYGLAIAIAVAIGELVVGLIIVSLALRYFPETKLGRRMILGKSQANQRASLPHPPDLVGKAGTAHTVLRPAGVALIEGNRLDVVAESGMIEAGSAVRIIAVEGSRIVVRKT